MTMTTKDKRIDFEKIDLLRRSMLLTVGNMANLYGVSRETYYNWLAGKYPRRKMEDSVRVKTRRLLELIAIHEWPTPDIIVADQKTRFEKLLALLDKQS